MENIPGLETHLDADTLAAFAEHSQRGDEEEAVFAHLAECETCREYLAVNAELKGFVWNAGKTHDRGPLRPAFGSRSFRTAARIACAIASLWLLFSLQPFRRAVMVESSRKVLAKRPGNRSLGGRNAGAFWGNIPLQKFSIDNQLAARNSHRFFQEVTLVTVSLGGGRTAGDASDMKLAVNQIAVKTALGERWITVEGFWKASAQRFRPSSSQSALTFPSPFSP